MTYDEITLWRRFMQGKGVLNNFEYLYREHKFDKRELDQYLEDVQAEDVILSAFDFTGAGNSIFGFKYWKDMDQKWQVKLTEYRETGNLGEQPAQVYCKHCGRLLPYTAFAITTKGLLHKHCKECEGGEWDRKRIEQEKAEKEKEKQEKAMRQLEKEIAEKQAKLERLAAGQEPVEPLSNKETVNNRAESAKLLIEQGQANLDKTTKVCAHCGKRFNKSHFAPSDTSEDGLQSWCIKCQTAAFNVSNEADKKAEKEARIAKEQSYMVVKATDDDEAKPAAAEKQKPAIKPIKPDKLTAPKLGEYDATLHYKQGQKSLTLNATLSAQIRDGQFTKCYLNIDRQHHVFLLFNRVEGANITGASNLATQLLNVCSSDISRQLADRFHLTLGENYYLHITKNLSKRDDFLTVEVLQARTREEYVAIAQRREDVAKGKIPPFEAEDDNPTEGRAACPTEDRLVKPTEASPVVPQPATPEMPLIDFAQTITASSKPDDILDYLIDNGHVTERDLATYLHQKGWELQEPVIVKKLKKFTL